MPRRSCPVTQSAIARALRAAKQEGAGAVRIEPDGTIWIVPQMDAKWGTGENPQLAKERLAERREAVL
jgi:hypothetical protein